MILFKSIYEKRNFSHLDEKPYGANYLYDIYSLYLNSSKTPFEDWLTNKNKEQNQFINIYLDIIEEFIL